MLPSLIRRSMSRLPRIQPPVSLGIALNDVESRIFTLLDDCTREMREKGRETSCRVAGGWVRDKLLGSESNDIDIALADMMGAPFAEELSAYAQTQDLPAGHVAKIKSNPNQSKHLETARFTLLGIEMDFVNLRSEEYAESRIPTEVTFGTPLQDALRRDTTINALFYNVHTREVEDWTKQGLDDLRAGIIRTPLAPRETFIDDPLRVIRCIRFASRFGFELVPELRAAASEESIEAALIAKISRERVGEEISKMLKGRDPLLSIQLIHELGLYNAIFHLPATISAKLSEPVKPISHSLVASTILHTLLYTPSPALPAIHPTLLADVLNNSSDRARVFLATALTPYGGLTYSDAKKKRQLAVDAVVREGLSLGSQNHFNDGVPALFSAAPFLSGFVMGEQPLEGRPERVVLGLLLKEKAVDNPITGSHWATSLLFSLVQRLVPLYDVAAGEFNVTPATQMIERYNAFVRRVEELELPTAIDAKPILGGREVGKALGAKSPGQWTGLVLSKVIEWQLEHPHGTEEDCVEWLREEQREGRVVVVEDVGKRGKK